MSKIHIWIGTTKKSKEEYFKYFELDYSTEGDFDDPDYKECGFCIDISEKWYDEDMIGIIPVSNENKPIVSLLEEIPLKKSEYDKVVNRCNLIGLNYGNAIFYYTDSELVINKPYKNNYNDLKYVGFYESILK
jgi:hypothetical protein